MEEYKAPAERRVSQVDCPDNERDRFRHILQHIPCAWVVRRHTARSAGDALPARR